MIATDAELDNPLNWGLEQQRVPPPCAMVIFGATGDLNRRKLMPALYRLAHPEWECDIDYHVNEFYLLENAKFSTSRRHAVWGKEILNERSVDAVRYYLSRTRPEGRRTSTIRPS